MKKLIHCIQCKKVYPNGEWLLDASGIPIYYRKTPVKPIDAQDIMDYNSGKLAILWYCSAKCSTEHYTYNNVEETLNTINGELNGVTGNINHKYKSSK